MSIQGYPYQEGLWNWLKQKSFEKAEAARKQRYAEQKKKSEALWDSVPEKLTKQHVVAALKQLRALLASRYKPLLKLHDSIDENLEYTEDDINDRDPAVRVFWFVHEIENVVEEELDAKGIEYDDARYDAAYDKLSKMYYALVEKAMADFAKIVRCPAGWSWDNLGDEYGFKIVAVAGQEGLVDWWKQKKQAKQQQKQQQRQAEADARWANVEPVTMQYVETALQALQKFFTGKYQALLPLFKRSKELEFLAKEDIDYKWKGIKVLRWTDEVEDVVFSLMKAKGIDRGNTPVFEKMYDEYCALVAKAMKEFTPMVRCPKGWAWGKVDGEYGFYIVSGRKGMESFEHKETEEVNAIPSQEGLISWWKGVRERWKHEAEVRKASKEYRPALVAWVKAHPIPRATLEATFKQIQNLFQRKYKDYEPVLQWDLRDMLYEADKMLKDGLEEIPVIIDIDRQCASYARELQRRTGRLDDLEVAELAMEYEEAIDTIMNDIAEFIVAPEFWEFTSLSTIFNDHSWGFSLKKEELLKQLGAMESLKLLNPKKYYALMSDGLGSTDSSDPLIDSVPPPTREDGDQFPGYYRDADYEKDPKVTKEADITIDINRDEERQLHYHQQKMQLMLTLNSFDRVLRNRQMNWLGQEGFKDFMSDHLTGLLDCMGHIGSLFKTGFLYGWKDFKRSEIAVFCGSNMATVNRIYRIPYGTLIARQCDIPQGMKGTYKQAVDIIDAFLTKLDMYTKSKAMLATMEAIDRSLKSTNPDFTQASAPVNPQVFDSTIDKLFEDSSKIFTTDVTRRDAVFGDVFGSMDELKYCVDKAIQMDGHLRQVSAVYQNMQKIETIMGHVVSAKDKIRQDTIDSIVEIVRTWARYFDTYSTICNDLNRIDHNLALVMTTLKASFM